MLAINGLAKVKALFGRKSAQSVEEAQPNLAVNIVNSLKRLLKRSETAKEAEVTPKGHAYVHYCGRRDSGELKNRFHVFGPEGLIACGDVYAEVVQATEATGVKIDDQDLLTSRTETSGSVLFFGDGAIWVDMGELGLAALRLG